MSRSSRLLVVAFIGAQAAAAQTPVPGPPSPVGADSLYLAGDWLGAKAEYDAFLATNPTSITSRIRAGFAALKAGRPDDAIGYFERVRSAAPQGRAPVALAGLGMAHAVKGDRAAALSSLEAAVAAGYGNVTTLDQDPSLASVRSDPRFVELRRKAMPNQLPCADDPDARAFDFWVGEWDAFPNGAGMQAGTSVIQRASGGCMILENWTTWPTPWNGPYEGKSMNFFQPETRKWRQVWVGSGRDITYFDDGEYRDGAMRFVYHTTNRQGQKVEGHFIFYNLGPNKVRQFQDQSTDGGKTYTVVYDFIYVRKGSGEGHLPRISP